MVGYTPGQTQLSHQSHILAGAASGVVTRIVTQPLDVLKIRFQVSKMVALLDCESQFHVSFTGCVLHVGQLLKQYGYCLPRRSVTLGFCFHNLCSVFNS